MDNKDQISQQNVRVTRSQAAANKANQQQQESAGGCPLTLGQGVGPAGARKDRKKASVHVAKSDNPVSRSSSQATSDEDEQATIKKAVVANLEIQPKKICSSIITRSSAQATSPIIQELTGIESLTNLTLRNLENLQDAAFTLKCANRYATATDKDGDDGPGIVVLSPAIQCFKSLRKLIIESCPKLTPACMPPGLKENLKSLTQERDKTESIDETTTNYNKKLICFWNCVGITGLGQKHGHNKVHIYNTF